MAVEELNGTTPKIIKATKTLAAGKKCKRCTKVVTPGELVLPVEFTGGITGWQHAECAAETDPLIKRLLSSSMDLDGDQMSQVLDKAEQAASAAAQNVIKDAMSRVEAAIASEIKKAKIPHVIEIRTPKATKKMADVTHPQFSDVARMIGAGLKVYLPGPAGCGKTHMAGQVAEALGLDFYPLSLGGATSESHLLGKQTHDITKGVIKWLASQMMKGFTKGGLVLVDELDSCDPNVLICLNGIAEKGPEIYCQYDPNEPMKKRHPDFRLIAAANTLGHGADKKFVGRFAQDAALLSRFVYLPLNYSEAVDRAVCPDDVLRNHLLQYRSVISEARLPYDMSSRFLQQAFELRQAGFSIAQIEQIFFNQMTPTEANRCNPRLKYEWTTYA